MLSDLEKQHLREHMIAEMAQAEDTLVHLREAARAVAPDNALGRLTRMDAIGDQAMAKAKLSQLEQKLDHLKRALQLLPTPGFGVCASCRQPIPLERLLIIPDTRVCVPCLNRAQRPRR